MARGKELLPCLLTPIEESKSVLGFPQDSSDSCENVTTVPKIQKTSISVTFAQNVSLQYANDQRGSFTACAI